MKINTKFTVKLSSSHFTSPSIIILQEKEQTSSSPSICPLSVQVLSPNAIAVKTPVSPRPGEVDITLVFKNSQFCINSPGKFLYIGELQGMGRRGRDGRREGGGGRGMGGEGRVEERRVKSKMA